jgi:hypothetical protein
MSTYIDLKADIQTWLADDDISPAIPTFIRLCEARINRVLRTLAQETIVSATVQADETLSGTNYVTLPDDFIEIVAITSNETQDSQPLDYVSPDRMVNESYPGFYSIKSNIIMLPTGVSTIVLTYMAKFPELTDTVTTNWLTANAYDALLYGSLSHAEGYLVNDERIALWHAGFKSAVDEINAQDETARTSGNTLRVI